MKNYKAVIYDIDGTVLNTLKMNMYPLMKIIKEELNEDWTFEEVLKFASYPGMKVMEELNIKDQEGTYQRWVRYVNEYEEGATLYPGFERVFATLDAVGMIQAVVSAKTQAQYQIDMADKGLDRFMKTAILADDTIRQAAKNAGIDFGYAKWGNVAKETMADAAFVFESPEDLLELMPCHSEKEKNAFRQNL